MPSRLIRILMALLAFGSMALAACSSPAPVDDGRASIPGRLDRAERAQDELSKETSGR
jgi:hypothetical protein